jgi:uncharacterized protein YacL
MFVEVTRIFIVLMATAAGFALGQGGATEAGNGAVIGAVLGACVGYVAGGMLGRLIDQVMGRVERNLNRTSAASLLAGAVGGSAMGLLSALVGLPAVILLPGRWGWPVFGLIVWVGIYEGFAIAMRRAEELLALAGLSTRPLVRATPFGGAGSDAILVDTSAVIDGRLLTVARAGFLTGVLLVPRFVLDELQSIADAQDPLRRRKGQRGLDLLAALQEMPGSDVHVLDDEVTEYDEVDAKLVALARRLEVRLLTVDTNLQRVAELQGVHCLNLHRLADGLRPALVPGETVRLPISREGKEPGQGVGFLDDGTMVVVGDAAPLVGSEVEVRITGNAQTSVGRMLFATVTE